ncbi:hypothetical protein SAMN05216562_3129 [Microbulbifer marinus]|uniref:Uncharacterized protein n=1 Tax=Microbulbifer marinus TaxID=658218 RepID=A0A1H4B6E4_9GAMM|nr:hypothetical protein SAMN05216562_3129 [Microbulbifer marinus]
MMTSIKTIRHWLTSVTGKLAVLFLRERLIAFGGGDCSIKKADSYGVGPSSDNLAWH